MPRERVLIHSDGLRLVGEVYVPTGHGPWPGIVVCHGLGSRKERHADFGAFAAGKGFLTLAFDLRGHGESEGKLDAGAWRDVAAAAQYLSSRPDADPRRIAVRGSSLGGHLAIQAVAQSPNVRAVVVISPAPEEMLAEGLRRAIDDGVDLPDVRLDTLSLPRYFREANLRGAVRRVTPRPLLLIHCTGDQVIPYDRSMELYRLAGDPKELWLVNGGNHTSAQHDGSVHERTAKWLQRHLTP